VLAMLGNVIRDFKIYYVLNRFNSITDSVEKIVKPFTESIHNAISPYLRMINLGWIVEDDRFLKSATQKVPLLLQGQDQRPVTRKMDTDLLNQWMSELKKEFAPLPRPTRFAGAIKTVAPPPPPRPVTSRDPLSEQLSLLKAMFENQDKKDF